MLSRRRPKDADLSGESSKDPADFAGAGGEDSGHASEAEGQADESEALQVRLAELELELSDARDRYVRTLAEMENLRRRSRVEIENAARSGSERLAGELLPVLDNFERAMQTAASISKVDELLSGVELIHRQLFEALRRAGVRRIECIGLPFDPNLHEAIMRTEAEDGTESGVIVEELRPGYLLQDRVLRASLVKVTA